MGQRYLVDTNIAVAYLDNSLPENIAHLIEESGSNISVITRIEFLVWRNASPDQLDKLQRYIDASSVYNLDEQIILKSIEIRRGNRIKLPDVIIAATAIAYKLKLITRNSADFEKIPNLEVINPFQ